MVLPAGIAKLVAGTLVVGGLAFATFNAVKPSAPLTPQARYSQAVQQHGDQSKAAREARRYALRRGIDVRTLERLRTKPLNVGKPSWLSRVASAFGRRIPKPRISVRIR